MTSQPEIPATAPTDTHIPDIGHFLGARNPLPSLWDFSFLPLRLVLRDQEEREKILLSFRLATALSKEGAAGGVRGSWRDGVRGSGKRGGGSRKKEKRKESRGRKPPLSLLVSLHLLYSTPLNKSWLVLVTAGKNRQIWDYLCLQRIR